MGLKSPSCLAAKHPPGHYWRKGTGLLNSWTIGVAVITHGFLTTATNRYSSYQDTNGGYDGGKTGWVGALNAANYFHSLSPALQNEEHTTAFGHTATVVHRECPSRYHCWIEYNRALGSSSGNSDVNGLPAVI